MDTENRSTVARLTRTLWSVGECGNKILSMAKSWNLESNLRAPTSEPPPEELSEGTRYANANADEYGFLDWQVPAMSMGQLYAPTSTFSGGKKGGKKMRN